MKKVMNINVDAGLIMVCDVDYIKSVNKEKSCGEYDYKLKPGKYSVSWSCGNTHRGRISGTDKLTVTSGMVVISDPCYVLLRDSQDGWCKWCDKYFDGKVKTVKAFFIDSMGGDGCFKFTFNFKKED